MSKIVRRHATVTLHHGNYQQDLADLMEQAMAALRAEEAGATRRAGTKSKATALAKQYDDLLAEAEASATQVTVWALSHTEFDALTDDHPPRDGEAADQKFGLNMKSFPPALLKAALVEPGTQGNGQAILDALDLSQVHYKKLETAAWNVNVGDDELPKFSMVSLLKQARDPESKQPSGQE